MPVGRDLCVATEAARAHTQTQMAKASTKRSAPVAHRSVEGAGDQGLGVRVQGHATHSSLVARQLQHLLACAQLKDRDLPAHRLRASEALVDVLLLVPDLGGPHGQRGGGVDEGAVQREGDARRVVLLHDRTVQVSQLPGAEGLQYDDARLVGARRDHLAVRRRSKRQHCKRHDVVSERVEVCFAPLLRPANGAALDIPIQEIVVVSSCEHEAFRAQPATSRHLRGESHHTCSCKVLLRGTPHVEACGMVP
mmetsp:Transcript_108651/g.350749  ORF Transcript_108651/g.350749 Transcript_108651/m.350749 type:complete len:251 (+) Transcript_108651:149-901(+)